MALMLDVFLEILRKPTMGGVALELASLAAPLWLAVLVGLLVGWVWRPRWATGMLREPACSATAGDDACRGATLVERADTVAANEEELAVNTADLAHLRRLVEEEDGGLPWIKMMDEPFPTMRYQAWRREPKNGPPQYRSSTIFEDASPEVVRDFFWDDEFRTNNGWDDMLLHHEMLEECTATGTMVVRWVKKFPIFCDDREYIIARRIWASGNTYYCVTKGVRRPSVPRRSRSHRVDLYYSSWCIRPVESRGSNGAMTACEVLLFHHENMGISWHIAKLAVRKGMASWIRRLEPGLRAYQTDRRPADGPISKYAAMAHVTTKFSDNELIPTQDDGTEAPTGSTAEMVEAEKPKHWASNIPRVLMIGGAVALACTFDRGLVTKAVIFGVARRFAGPGRR